jgi:hypothetical protein
MGEGSFPQLRDQVATGTCVWQWVQDHSSAESTLGEVRQMADERGENWHGCGDNDAVTPVAGNETVTPVSGNETVEGNP